MLQPMYNLVKRQAEVEILPMALSEGFAVVPYSPLGGGLLSGKYASGETGRLTDDPMYTARYAPDWMHGAAKGLSDIAADTRHPSRNTGRRLGRAAPRRDRADHLRPVGAAAGTLARRAELLDG